MKGGGAVWFGRGSGIQGGGGAVLGGGRVMLGGDAAIGENLLMGERGQGAWGCGHVAGCF